jgi:hypothetical protein
MTCYARQKTTIGPTTIAIHDDSNMVGGAPVSSHLNM